MIGRLVKVPATLTLLGVFAVLVLLGSSTSVAAMAGVVADPCVGANCGVVTDPQDAAYVGSGGLLLPADSFTGSPQDRLAAATCEGCQWALALMCRGDGPRDVTCTPAAQSCTGDQVRYVVFLWRPENPQWVQVGLVCMSRSGPTTVADLADLLRDYVVEDVPPLRPSMQPDGRTLVQLPTLFAAGQRPSLGARRFDLVGFSIVLRAEATWDWRFGDGGQLSTAQPGGTWPDASVAHVYRTSGRFPVTVTSSWRAWFSVDGQGPFPVGGAPVVQVAPAIPVDVLEARAELIAG